MNEIELFNKEMTMSSLEISKLTGKMHKNIIRDIENMFNELEDESFNRLKSEPVKSYESKFKGTYKDTKGEERICYNLPKRECDILISGYSIKYRAAIIDRWYKLENEMQEEIKKYIESLENDVKYLSYDNKEQSDLNLEKSKKLDRREKELEKFAIQLQKAKGLPIRLKTELLALKKKYGTLTQKERMDMKHEIDNHISLIYSRPKFSTMSALKRENDWLKKKKQELEDELLENLH